ncbi:hypothetical protein BDZ45DRAFT_747899 [Acephala macrosclerotiorum]|nr:hypothetical protein BDZ45DRAFT_747899 [Acephala macrosclerotiorum]
MSFGFGVADFVTLGTKAWEVYKSCKEAPNSFRNVSDEVLSLHAVLRESEEVLKAQPFSLEQRNRLGIVLNGCSGVLSDLQHAVNRCESLGTKSKRTWDRLGWGQQPIVEMRSRSTANIVLLSAFVKQVSPVSLIHDNAKISPFPSTSQILVEKRLRSVLQDFRGGRCEGSIISTRTIDSLCIEDEEAWRGIRGELEEAGITVAAFDLNKQFIIDWLRKELANATSDTTTSNGEHCSITELSTAIMGMNPQWLEKTHIVDPSFDFGNSNKAEELMLEIGNTHQLIKPNTSTPQNKHYWTFFVQPSRTDVFEQVIFYLHPTFRPPSIVHTSPPYEVGRVGWDTFVIDVQLTLRRGYSWQKQHESQKADFWHSSAAMTVHWELQFNKRMISHRLALRFEKDERHFGGASFCRVNAAQ